jgi:hypothetical protein
MTAYFLTNTVRVATRVIHAGTPLDDVATDTAEIRRAGGVLWPADDPLVAAAAARVAKMRGQGIGDDSLDRIMASASAESTQLGPRNWTPSAAALVSRDDTMDGGEVWTIDTRVRFVLVRASTAPIDGVGVIASKSSNGGALAGRWVADFVAADAADLSRSYAEDVPVTSASLASTGDRYTLAPTSTAAANGTTTINARRSAASFDVNGAPVGLGTHPGRWLKR